MAMHSFPSGPERRSFAGPMNIIFYYIIAYPEDKMKMLRKTGLKQKDLFQA